jgi:hypothetical protein
MAQGRAKLREHPFYHSSSLIQFLCAQLALEKVMSETGKRSQVILAISKQEDCLKQLKAAGASPAQMLCGMLIFITPSIVKSVTTALVVIGILFGVRI